ncbi:Uncharacterized protein PBTT_01833 [Plasmodiophora brassicae]
MPSWRPVPASVQIRCGPARIASGDPVCGDALWCAPFPRPPMPVASNHARRQVKDAIKAARKLYYAEWKVADDARKAARAQVLAEEKAAREARLKRLEAEWAARREREAAENAVRQAEAERRYAQTWQKAKAQLDAHRLARNAKILSPVKSSLGALIDSTNIEQRITMQVPLNVVKLRGLPEIDIFHQSDLLMQYMQDPLDKDLDKFEKESAPEDSMFSQFSGDFLGSPPTASTVGGPQQPPF